MTCGEVIQALCEYLDDDLEAEVTQALRCHLEDCEHCRIVVDTTRKTVEIYCNTEPRPLPEGVHERLQRAWAEKSSRNK